MNRREFLRRAGMSAAAAAFAPDLRRLFGGISAQRAAATGLSGGSILDLPATAAPIDHIVVLMMENRSFDHFLGWLATDEAFLDNGRRLYGEHFSVDGDVHQAYNDPEGSLVETYYLPGRPGESNPYRGCDHPDPGHGWNSGRAQRDGGFLHPDSGNDEFSIGYYQADDVNIYADLARRFTVFDRYHCSILAPTYPNREYLHAAQSGGNKSNDIPVDTLGFQWPTISDRLNAASVPVANYFVDLPSTLLWGPRMIPGFRHLESFFLDCALGLLPNVTFVDPGFTTGLRTDDHPHGDMRSAQKFVFNVVKAFMQSPHWNNGALFLTYDEWGGFFDHVPPPLLPDDRASTEDQENFGQAGFRVPTIMLSPYARRGFVDHSLYDHTSILRFIEWRFLGAPAEGPDGNSWWLTSRDRNANNIGRSLRAESPDPEVHLELLPQIPIDSLPCDGDLLDLGLPLGDLGVPLNDVSLGDKHSFEIAMEEGVFERMGFKADLKPLPYP
ncbi:MAG: alkaline phosphatase family protein [Actinomycetota bacterium]